MGPLTWWITFEDGRAACYEGTRSDVEERAATNGKPIACDQLPYPAHPRTSPKSGCPSFCYTPEKCKGHGSCPKDPCCTS